MGDKTGIEWTDATWNPIVGCSIVSPACTNCYAMAQAARIERMNEGDRKSGPRMREGKLQEVPVSHYAGTTEPSKAGPVWTGKMAQAPDHILTAPLRWKRPRRIFVNSMGDLFHESVPDEWIDKVFAVMAKAPQHSFQVLTKRADRMRRYVSATMTDEGRGRLSGAAIGLSGRDDWSGDHWSGCDGDKPLPNVWLGVTAEDQARADERIPDLLATPAAKRFVSCEPLLSEIDLHEYLGLDVGRLCKRNEVKPGETFLSWVISGGESGPNARPSHPDWFRSLRDQCAAAGVPFFFKQWGEWVTEDQSPEDIVLPGESRLAWANNLGSGDQTAVYKVGKRRAGSLLDGREHKEFPL